jgi:NADPH2:quinone reductase
MKAVVIEEFGGPEVLRYRDVPDPSLSPASVLVEVRAVGVNRGDLQLRAGEAGDEQLPLPLIVGWEVAGVVKAVGDLVQHVQQGERVVAIMPSGGYAELAAPIAQAVVPIPRSLSFEEAAGIPIVFMTAWFALVKKAALRPGETALVQAAGSGVGMAGVQIAKHVGARAIATAGSEEKLARARDLGAELLRSGAIEEFQKVVDLCGRGELKVIVDRVLPLAEAAAAHAVLAERANFGKVILKP